MRWAVFFGVCVLAAMVTPHGLTGLLFPLRMTNLGPALNTIEEWQASSMANNLPLMFWLLLLLFGSLIYGLRLPICRLLMLLLLVYMALAHRRHAELLGLAAPLLLQYAIAEALSRSAPSLVSNWGILAQPRARGALVGIALAAVLISTVIVVRGVERGPDRFSPQQALDAVEARGIKGPVLNAYNFGGYLIFRDRLPFIDGRADMYGSDFITRYNRLDQLTALLAQYRIAWTIFEPNNPRVALMDNLSGWSRIYADATAVIHVREPPLPP